VRPRHDPVSVTQVVSCCRPVGPIIPGRPKAQIGFLFLFFLLNVLFNKKPFNITKFKVQKHDFALNIDIQLFYTIFIKQVVLCRRANRADHQAASGRPNRVLSCLAQRAFLEEPGHGTIRYALYRAILIVLWAGPDG
jgi:hypothetical protein